MRYSVAMAASKRGIEKAVNGFLAKGWKLQGGIDCEVKPGQSMWGPRFAKNRYVFTQALKK